MFRNDIRVLGLIVFCVAVLGAGWLRAQEPGEIDAIAIYRATESFQGDISDSDILFNVTDQETIQQLLSSIDFADPRDGLLLKSKINSFVYLRSTTGEIQAYEVYLAWQYFAHRGQRERSYLVSPEGQELFATLAQ